MNGTYSTPELEPYLILGQELMRHVYADDSPAEIITWLNAQIAKLHPQYKKSPLMTWQESFAEYDKIMTTRASRSALPESERRSLTWPWRTWNDRIDPLEPGLLFVLAGADGAGKTLYAENVAEHWAKMGRQVVYLHFELSRAVMLDRRMIRQSGIERRTLLSGVLTTQQAGARTAADKLLSAYPGAITYAHVPGWTVESALTLVRSLIAEQHCDVFIVDYLEKAAPSGRQMKLFGSNKFEREADDVEQIKSFSESTGLEDAPEIPAMMVAQLNKLGKGKALADLSRSDIRGAGEKTEKGNIVVLLHHEDENPEVNVKIDKNTMGPTCSFKQYMNKARFLVADIAEQS